MNCEISLAPFCNWFLPSCLDIWSSSDEKVMTFAYGARSAVCLMNIKENNSIETQDSVNAFKNNKIIISTVKFAKYGSFSQRPHLFIGSNDGEAAVIDCTNKAIIRPKVDLNLKELPSKKILSADWVETTLGSFVFYCMHHLIVSWNVTTGKVRPIDVGDNFENRIAISCIASNNCGNAKLAVGFMNGDISILSLQDMQSYSVVERKLNGHSDDICALAFSFTKGQYAEGVLASASRDGFIKIWDCDVRNNISDVKLDAMKSKHKNWFALAFIPTKVNGTKFELMIGSGNGELVTIDIPVKPPSSKIRIHKPVSLITNKDIVHTTVVFAIAVDPKQMLAITTSLDHQIIVWDLKERKALNSVNTLTHGVHDISISPIDPNLLAVAIGDGVQILKLTNDLKTKYQRRLQVFKLKMKEAKGLAVVWHPELENRLAIASSCGEITVIDIKASQVSTKYSTLKLRYYDNTKIYCLLWGPALNDTDCFALYCVHQSGNLYLHYPSSDQFCSFDSYVNNKKKRCEMRWKCDYSYLAVGNNDGTVDIFVHQNKQLRQVLEIDAFKRPILCMKWNAKIDDQISNWLAISSYDNSIQCYQLHKYLGEIDNKSEDLCIKVVDKCDQTLKGHLDRVSSLSWCPFDANKLVSVSYDRTAQIWDVIHETPLINFRGHRGILYCVEWSSADEDVIFSGGEDNYFHGWRPSKQPFKTPHPNSETNTCIDWPHLQEDSIDTNGTESQSIDKLTNGVIDRDLDKEMTAEKYLNGDSSETFNHKNFNSINRKPKKKNTNKETRKLSLFPLSNGIEFSSSKYEKLEDIEALFEKKNGISVSKEKLSRILLYGDIDDIKLLIRNEVSHHEKHGNKGQKDILNLLLDIKSTIEQSIVEKEMNTYLLSLSTAVSRALWTDSCKLMAQLLADDSYVENDILKWFKVETSAIYMLSVNQIKESIDLLIKNQLYREAIIISKLNYESDECIENIMTLWAQLREKNGDCEGAAKCLTAISKFNEAASLLNKIDDQQFQHTVYVLRSK